jgi:hypothetical protein
MKKLILLSYIILLAFLSQPLNAQVQIGVQAGLNLTDVNMELTEENFETAMRTRAIIGGILTYNFSPMLALQFEPAYVQKGALIDFPYSEDGLTADVELSVSANYLDLPILLKVSLLDGPVKPYLLGGGSVALLLGDAKIKVEKATINGQDVINMIPQEEREQVLDLKTTDYIVCFGGGVTIPLSLFELFIEGRYDLGLTDVYDVPDDGTTVVPISELKTTGIQIKAGLLFSL